MTDYEINLRRLLAMIEQRLSGDDMSTIGALMTEDQLERLATLVNGGSALTAAIAETVPEIKRGKVWCLACGREQAVDGAACLARGWPKCCGHTMTIDHPMERLLRANGYHPVRQLPGGEWAAVIDMLATVALCVGCDGYGYRTRFCFARRADAEAALASWDGAGDPPGPWLKQKSENRPNPAGGAA